MIITPKMAIEQGLLITNGKGKSAQIGYDLTLIDVREITNGMITTDKAIIKPYKNVELIYLSQEDSRGWILKPGVYSLTFEQEVKLSNEHCAFIHPRSSILRSGATIGNSVFDPGFSSILGATLFVHNEIAIEEGARVAQIVIHECYPAEIYNGNYQGKKDLK